MLTAQHGHKLLCLCVGRRLKKEKLKELGLMGLSKVIAVIGLLFSVIGALTLSMAPDVLSLIIVGLMVLVIVLGFFFGMVPAALYAVGFRRGCESIDQVVDVQSSTPWLAAQQNENFFHQRTLDHLYAAYVEKARQQTEEGLPLSDIEDVINDESLALRSWQRVVMQVPGTLTAMGLLGTFIGLITGISNIGFSSIEAALSSIEVLLAGIETAFFTSVAGVIFSLLFNVLYRLVWNVMLRELGVFTERFHFMILPSTEEQIRMQQSRDMKLILERLDRLPKDQGFSMAHSVHGEVDPASEQRMMPEIREGLKNGEFVFHIQPRCDLNTRRIIGGEALVRWDHGEMGLIAPAAFLPMVERNGFIVRIDRYIWEGVCQAIRRWIDLGLRPVPVSINVSKTDILAMDVAGFFNEMVHKYRIPPRNLEIEIAQNVYFECEAAARELEGQLRQAGFRVLVDGFRGDYAAVNLLKRCEADAVKLDLRFTSARTADGIVQAMEQAQKLGWDIVAEGIENTEQLTVLRRSGCTEGQGFYLHRPMPVDEFEQKMRQE